MHDSINERWKRYETLAEGRFQQSRVPEIQAFFERLEEEGVDAFGDFHTGDFTFFNAPRKSSFNDIDIACVGVPFETSAPLRAGSRFGPRSFREWSKARGPVHDKWKTIPFEMCSVVDFGDVEFESPHSIDDCVEQVARVYSKFREAGVTPYSVGGVHTMTHPILRGLAGGEPIGLVHIDAHADTSRGSFQGNTLSDCSVFLNSVLDKSIDPERTVQIGMRGALSVYWDFSHEAGMRVISMNEVFEIGAEGVVAEIRRVIGDGPFYFTMDADGIDATFMPGTQLPEPFGLTTREILHIVRGMRGMDMIGADFVELCPPYDPHNIGANIGSAIGFEVLCLLAEARVNRTGLSRKTHWA